MGELSDDEVFGSPTPVEMSDADVFGAKPVAKPEPNNTPLQNDSVDQLKAVATNLGITPEELTSRRSAAQKGVEQQMTAANEAKPWYQKAAEGIPRGMEQAMVGTTQLLEGHPDMLGNQQMGKGDIEDLQQVAKNLELQGKGSGISGTLGEAAGQITNPINMASLAAPEGVLGRIAGGVMMGATQPQTKEGQLGSNVGTGAVVNTVVPPIVKGAGSVVQSLANKTGLTDLVANISEKLGANPTTSKLYQAAKSIGLDIKGKSPQAIKDNLQSAFTKTTGDIRDIVSGGNQLNPIAANTAISHQYDNELNQSGQLYNKVKELGEGKFADASDLLTNTNGLINQMEKRKFLEPKEERALDELKYWRDKIAEGSKNEIPSQGNVVNLFFTEKTPDRIAFNDVVDLKQALNQNFDSSKFPSRSDTPFAKLNSNVNNILDTISKQTDITNKSPEFDFTSALKKANDHWTDISRTYKNDLINQFWTPEDYYESKALAERAIPLSTSLRKRARGWLDNIKTPEDLETLTNALPVDAGNAVKGAKFNQIMDKAGIDPQAIYNNKDTLDRIFRNNPEASKLLDNITTIMDGLNDKGLNNNMPSQIDREALKGSDSALRSMWSIATNHKLYALKHAINALAPGQKGTGKLLKSFQKEVNKGSPYKNAISEVAEKSAKPLSTLSTLTTKDKSND